MSNKKPNKRPQLLHAVLKAITELKETKGSSTSSIVNHVRMGINFSRSNPRSRNIVMQVRKALRHALLEGFVVHRAGKYRLATSTTSNKKVVPVDSLEIADLARRNRGRRRSRRRRSRRRRSRRRRSRRRRSRGRRGRRRDEEPETEAASKPAKADTKPLKSSLKKKGRKRDRSKSVDFKDPPDIYMEHSKENPDNDKVYESSSYGPNAHNKDIKKRTRRTSRVNHPSYDEVMKSNEDGTIPVVQEIKKRRSQSVNRANTRNTLEENCSQPRQRSLSPQTQPRTRIRQSRSRHPQTQGNENPDNDGECESSSYGPNTNIKEVRRSRRRSRVKYPSYDEVLKFSAKESISPVQGTKKRRSQSLNKANTYNTLEDTKIRKSPSPPTQSHTRTRRSRSRHPYTLGQEIDSRLVFGRNSQMGAQYSVTPLWGTGEVTNKLDKTDFSPNESTTMQGNQHTENDPNLERVPRRGTGDDCEDSSNSSNDDDNGNNDDSRKQSPRNPFVN